MGRIETLQIHEWISFIHRISMIRFPRFFETVCMFIDHPCKNNVEMELHLSASRFPWINLSAFKGVILNYSIPHAGTASIANALKCVCTG